MALNSKLFPTSKKTKTKTMEEEDEEGKRER